MTGLRLQHAVRTDVGLQRENNEDAIYAGTHLLAVADGMGGHAAGEVASAVTIDTLVGLDTDELSDDVLGALTGAVETAQDRLRTMAERDANLQGMGTTLTALLRNERRLGLVHIGDSRGYLYREGALEQITHDHTLVQALVDEGRITAAEAEVHPRRSLLIRVLDGQGEVELDLSVRELRQGDRYLLCTDGLSDVLSETTIRDSLAAGAPGDAADRLVELALKAGAPDNVTVVVADVVADDGTRQPPVLVAGASPDRVDGDRDGAAADSPAVRAAELTQTSRRPVGRRSRRQPRGQAAHPRRRDRPRWRRLAVALVVGCLLAGGLLGGWLWLRGQYYVGVAAGGVAIYRGVPGSFAGLRLATVTRSDRAARAADLPAYAQQRLRAGITVSSLAAAERVVAALRSEEPAATRAGPGTTGPTGTPHPSRRPATSRPVGRSG